MPSALYKVMIRPNVLSLLGGLIPDQFSASALLVPLGADMARLPPFGTLSSEQWWFGALTMIDRGAFAFGLADLLAAIRTRFPGAEDLDELDGSVAGDHVPGAPRVLCLLTDPSDQARLNLAEEQRAIDRIAAGGRLTVAVHTATRVTDLVPAILAARPDVVHFAGHGDENGNLLFQDESGLAVPVSARALGLLFGSVGRVACCFLSSCYSGGHAGVLGSADSVVGSSEMFFDDEALAFVRGFYEAIAVGRTPLQAYGVGCASMELAGLSADKMRYADKDRSIEGCP